MFIKSIRICNYRSITDSGVIPFDQSLTFIGPNGSGKSNILKAIKSFFDENSIVNQEDYYGRMTESPILFQVIFRDLNQEETNHFSTYIRDSLLSVQKQFTYAGGPTKGEYVGRLLKHAGFDAIRKTAGREKISAYKEFRSEHSNDYPDLPSAASGTAIEKALQDWEGIHQDRLEWIDAPVQFFGARNVGGGSLDNFTRFVLVPAVRDATLDASDSKGSALGELVNILVKEVILQRQELQDFRRTTLERFKELTDPERFAEIPELERRLTARLQTLVPDSTVHLLPGEMKEPVFSLPETRVELTEDGYRGRIEGKGHGLQRSFIISIIQELAMVQAQRDEQIRRVSGNQNDQTQGDSRIAQDFRPDLILAIEEPELFQHPIRQRHFAEVLNQLIEPQQVNERSRIQVILTSHSPMFVSIRRFGSVRLVLKEKNEGHPDISKINNGDPSSAAITYCNARKILKPDKSIFLDSLRNVLDIQVSEAFFAPFVVLVEGDDDKAAVEATFLAKVINPIKLGIPIIAVDGKCNLGRVKTVLETVGIQTFLIFDCDSNKTKTDEIAAHKLENETLMRLCGIADEKLQPFPTDPIISKAFACFPINLEECLSKEFKDYPFCESRALIAERRRLNKKSPLVYEELLNDAFSKGFKSLSFDSIIQTIISHKVN